MRTVSILALLMALGACKTKPPAQPEAQPDRNPYRNVMPDKVKKQVEDTLKKEDEANDKVLQNAK